MRICCTADLHGHLPDIPDCDLLLIAGDIFPLFVEEGEQARGWMRDTFGPWINDLGDRGVLTVIVPGNHDLLFEKEDAEDSMPSGSYTLSSLVGRAEEVYAKTNFHQKFRIYGVPWTENQFPDYGAWAFGVPTDEDLAAKWAQIPSNVDILLAHTPPDFCRTGDYTDGTVLGGSSSLTAWIDAQQPKLVVCGHTHGGYGLYRRGGTLVAHASHCDLDYKPANPPIVVTEADFN